MPGDNGPALIILKKLSALTPTGQRGHSERNGSVGFRASRLRLAALRAPPARRVPSGTSHGRARPAAESAAQRAGSSARGRKSSPGDRAVDRTMRTPNRLAVLAAVGGLLSMRPAVGGQAGAGSAEPPRSNSPIGPRRGWRGAPRPPPGLGRSASRAPRQLRVYRQVNETVGNDSDGSLGKCDTDLTNT
jgi:hypothetical protein